MIDDASIKVCRESGAITVDFPEMKESNIQSLDFTLSDGDAQLNLSADGM
jgi:hypothetical protein